MSLKKRLAIWTKALRLAIGGRNPVVERRAMIARRPKEAQTYFLLGPELALKRLNAGPALYVDPQDEQISASIILTGSWEPWVSAVVLSLLRLGDRAVEVGANIGYYTALMAARVGPEGFVTSLEANARLVRLIDRTVRVNGFVDRTRLIAKAAMGAPGTIDFVSFRSYSGGGHVPLFLDASYGEEHGEPERYQVEAVRLDDLGCGRVDLLRIDAEGSEPFILRGAEDLLRANSDIVICMEWSRVQIGPRVPLTEFLDWLQGLGFGFWLIGPPTGLTPMSREALMDTLHCDIVLSRRAPRLS